MTGFLGYWIIIMVFRLHFWCKCLWVHHCQGAVNSCNPLQKSLNKKQVEMLWLLQFVSSPMVPHYGTIAKEKHFGSLLPSHANRNLTPKRSPTPLTQRVVRVMWRSASVTAALLGECDVELSMDSPQVATAISNECGMYQGDVSVSNQKWMNTSMILWCFKCLPREIEFLYTLLIQRYIQ